MSHAHPYAEIIVAFLVGRAVGWVFAVVLVLAMFWKVGR